MNIDWSKKVFTREEAAHIIEQLQIAAEAGLVEAREEDNAYLVASFRGVEGAGISPKWNVKVYSYNQKKRGHSIVCNDLQVLQQLVEGDSADFTPPALPVFRIDDAGWGFPLCGVMVGVSDGQSVQVAVVPVEFFQDGPERGFGTGRYLQEYAWRAVRLLVEMGADPGTHRIEICSGYVNQPLRDTLRLLGFDTRIVEIKGLLQERLEQMYREHVQERIGADLYYDPKDMDKAAIPQRYQSVLAYGRQHCPHLLKTGWNALKVAGRGIPTDGGD